MNKIIKRCFSFLLAFQLFSITAYAKPDWPSSTGIQAEAGIVMDFDSGAVLFGQNIHVPYPPASITKLLTAMIVLEHCELDETVTFSQTAVNQVESDSGNKLGSAAGDQLSVEDCLYGLLMVSSNQAANALAEHTAGSIEAFVTMMNEKLAELGCVESHFDNPSGLNGDTQYVTAYDMAQIARAAYQNEDLLRINSATSHKLAPTPNYPGGLTVKNEHRLVITEDTTSQFYYPPAVAGKTGYLIKAGNTVVTYAESEGRRLVSVILKGQPRQYFVDCKDLLSFGFSEFQNINISEQEERYVTGDEILHLDAGDFSASDLKIDADAVLTLPKGASFTDADLTLEALPDDAPQDAVAQLRYTYNDRVVGTAWLQLKNPTTPTVSDGILSDTDNNAADNDGSNGNGLNNNSSGNSGSGNTAASTLDSDKTTSEQTGTGISVSTVITVLLLFAILAGIIGLAAWISYNRKKEAEAAALRRERRRKRLMASGDAEEFDRLLQERKTTRK